MQIELKHVSSKERTNRALSASESALKSKKDHLDELSSYSSSELKSSEKVTVMKLKVNFKLFQAICISQIIKLIYEIIKNKRRIS